MNRSQIIVVNTIAVYIRSVVSLALGLFSSRWVLEALGPSDFGLFSLVGSIIVFVTFFNSVMAGSASRHFAYSIGQGDSDEVKRWFNSALSFHVCASVVLVIAGWLAGDYAIAHILTIPVERLGAARTVFGIALCSAFFSMVSVPFIGMFTAKQRIAEMAVFGMLQTALSFSLAYALTRLSGDRLVFYSIGMAAIIVVIQGTMILRAALSFSECRLETKAWFDGRRIWEIGSFALWSFIGNAGATLRDQGTAILLNLHFGPKVNASYGISTQVSAATSQLSAAMMGAFSPEITRSEGSGDRARMLSLAQRANKFGTILVLLFALPLLIEIDYILMLWLKSPPEHTSTFCRLVIVSFLIDRLTYGYMLAVSAHGKIAAYQLTLGGLILLALPIAWLMLYLGFSAPSVVWAFVITTLMCGAGRVMWMKRLLDVPISQWFVKTALPCVSVALPSLCCGLAFTFFMEPSFIRLVCIVISTLMAAVSMTFFAAMDAQERSFMKNSVQRVYNKLCVVFGRAS